MSASLSQVLLEKDFLYESFEKLRNGELLGDEAANLTFLVGNMPNLIPNYMVNLEKGRRGILNRLVGSMLRENILNFSTNSHDLYVIDSIYALNVPAITSFWRMVIQQVQSYNLQSGKTYKLYSLNEDECLVIPVSRTYAFNRIEVDGEILFVTEKEVTPINHSVELLEIVRHKKEFQYESEKFAWEQLAKELINGSANLALSYAYWDQKKKELQKRASEFKITNVLDWVLFEKKLNSAFDSSLFFEQLSVEGHNLHPGTKTKIDMKAEDVFQYAPEFDGVAAIQFVGILKERVEWCVKDELEEDANKLLFKVYPELRNVVEQQFQLQGHRLEEYVIVPVHPWQLENAISVVYKQELNDQTIVPIQSFHVPCGSTSSFRTVVPLGNQGSMNYAIKVAVNSQMTSTVRTISANTTNNSTIVTRLIKSIMEIEQVLSKQFVPVYEIAGYNFKKENDKQKNRNLSAVLRENIESFTFNDEVAIVGSSLFSESPISEKTIVSELIEQYAKTTNESIRQAAYQFVSEYVNIALPGFLTLLVKYGIGLEGHLQNSVMVFKNGQPVRMLFRDWGGLRIYKERLKKNNLHVELYAGSITATDDLKEVHNKLFYTVFQNHLGELILQVCNEFGINERELWQEIHRICNKVFDKLKADPTLTENVACDREALYQMKVEHKALTKMRLDPAKKGYSYAIVPNPLHEFK
ncbi:IucA/IucC family protein [Gottfriedia acidiceleris]|uniref:IucA/IucC family protein n=1 Tax=Bacillaceae TaxID=186817 RepID=UPI000BEC2F81|nr:MULTISPECIES: IucA/IucC family protein [unclassified Bacillus (in: firmicutes)]PEC50586.1 IucA/IucC family protein [Bacillus sp. AFS096315]PFM81881.1 IucA/IucC family protein [Bacillus sp. AFS077874]